LDSHGGTDPKKFLGNPRVFQKLRKHDRVGEGRSLAVMEVEVGTEVEEERVKDEEEEDSEKRRKKREDCHARRGFSAGGREEQARYPDIQVRRVAHESRKRYCEERVKRGKEKTRWRYREIWNFNSN